jgi:hypothetical protein
MDGGGETVPPLSVTVGWPEEHAAIETAAASIVVVVRRIVVVDTGSLFSPKRTGARIT